VLKYDFVCLVTKKGKEDRVAKLERLKREEMNQDVVVKLFSGISLTKRCGEGEMGQILQVE
jgi:hypothetical protein